jgi:ADP-heptose:LPS heptosyltransferase
MSNTLILDNSQAPGDALMLTCALRDLHTQYPNRFVTSVACKTAQAVFANNPYVTNAIDRKKARHIKLGYSTSINRSNQRCAHFATGFAQDLSEKLGLRVYPTDLRPDIYLAPEERDPAIVGIDRPYWVMMAGGKSDFTNKIWDTAYYQAVVDGLPDIQFVQAGSARHIHAPLKHVVNMVGATSLREFLLLIAHSQGVVGPITCAMHAAAAFNKPCVVIAGGREPWWWEAYTMNTWLASIPYELPDDNFVEHRYLHTVGDLSCCKKGGCWKNGVGEKPSVTKNCLQVVEGLTRRQPMCMTMVSPSDVITAVTDYETGKPVVADEIPANLLPPLHTDKLKPRSKSMKHVRKSHERPASPEEKSPPPIQVESPVKRAIRARKATKMGRKRFSSKRTQRRAQREARVAAITANMPPPRYPMPGGPVAPTPQGSKKNLLPQEIPGYVTIGVLIYGDHLDIIKRCLSSIYASVKPKSFELRLGMNAVTPRVRTWVKENILDVYDNIVLYESEENIHKYPMMRRMLYEGRKVSTEWFLWFDDDSHVIHQKWLPEFWKYVTNTPKIDMVGREYFYWLKKGQVKWIKEAPWYTGKELQTRKKMPRSVFITGGWWGIRSKVLYNLDWPDPRIDHNGGDVMLGAALHQQGYVIKQYYYGVKISDAVRRGASQRHPGT